MGPTLIEPGTGGEVQGWPAGLEVLQDRIGQLQRKNGWTLAEQASERCPDGMQRLLNPGRLGRGRGP
ncbi:hypothetical protein EJ357_38545 [Streptomyces cyaneochromogenes]|uniref:Uncharacterized protein n=1 Tax=Streptomyces cyaneochromogenes TaxID=2496836 RepID=A0A3S9MHH1_9ACTN|nr:hypothetical protein [Streptomyces cyaneochromogenes]AZQ38627.1 hypothetical protein EJ357_38545 [Streptomyces cyaneochromogenes]